MAENQEMDAGQVEDIDPNDVALALAAGLCMQAGMDVQTAVHHAWMAGVPAFYDARMRYAEMARKMNEQYGSQQG